MSVVVLFMAAGRRLSPAPWTQMK